MSLSPRPDESGGPKLSGRLVTEENELATDSNSPTVPKSPKGQPSAAVAQWYTSSPGNQNVLPTIHQFLPSDQGDEWFTGDFQSTSNQQSTDDHTNQSDPIDLSHSQPIAQV